MRVTIKEMLIILILNMNYYIFLEVWTWTTRAIHLKEMRAYIGYKFILCYSVYNFKMIATVWFKIKILLKTSQLKKINISIFFVKFLTILLPKKTNITHLRQNELNVFILIISIHKVDCSNNSYLSICLHLLSQ